MSRKSYKPPSKIAARVYKALLLSGFTIIPEYTVGDRLRCDYFIRELNMLIECDGRQHDQLVPFYHGDKIGFRDSKKRDNRKEVLAGQQGYTLIRLTQKEILDSNSPEELLKIILHKITQSKRESEEEW